MVNAVHQRFAVGHQASNHQTGRGPQVGRHDGGAREFFNAFHDSNLAFNLDLRAQTHHFVDVHETIFKDGLQHRAGPVRNRIKRHELRLHIGREPRIFGGAKRLCLEATLGLNADKTIARCHHGTGLAQLVDHGIQVVASGM